MVVSGETLHKQFGRAVPSAGRSSITKPTAEANCKSLERRNASICSAEQAWPQPKRWLQYKRSRFMEPESSVDAKNRANQTKH